MENNKKKLSTGIKGLDDLFYGGIQIEQNSDNADGLLILARGEHGVNKIHLAMQMCEGLCVSQVQKREEVDKFESFSPLSSVIDDGFSFDEMLLLKMLLIKDVRKYIKEFAEKNANNIKKEDGKETDNRKKWKKFKRKYNEDDSFARECATRYLEEALKDNEKELIKSYWNSHYKNNGFQGGGKNKDEVSKVLKDNLLKDNLKNEEYCKMFLSRFVVEETIEDTLRSFSEFAKKQKDNLSLTQEQKKLWKKATANSVIVRDFVKSYANEVIEKELYKDQLDDYWENNKKEFLGNIITAKLNEEDAGDLIGKFNDFRNNLNLNKESKEKKILFISLNKDGESIKRKYYDFYIQRLIRNIKSENEFADPSVILLQRMIWYVDDFCCEKDIPNNGFLVNYGLPSILGTGCKLSDKETQTFKRHIRKGFIYYNGRTQGLHLRHQKGARDTGDMLLCKLYVPEDSLVRIIGRDELNNGNRMADGLISFNNLLTKIDNYLPGNKEGNEVDYIMVDGLSRLTKEEIAQCPFNALSDKLRKACRIGILTADEKLQSEFSSDIVIDMAIKERSNSDQLYHALRISKCLYQRNAYGWHCYNMRMAGIEVIPSIHFQMITRYLMDDVVADALLPINKDPYPYWLNESDCRYEDKDIRNAVNAYGDDEIDDEIDDDKGQIDFGHRKSALLGMLSFDKISTMNMVVDEILQYKNDIGLNFEDHHFVFIDMNCNRTEFKYNYYNRIVQINSNHKSKIHLFNFQPGYLYADEFMWTIDRQVQAISKKIKKDKMKDAPDTHYEQIHLIIGDLNYMNFAYPYLNQEGLILPAIASYTKKHHMRNYVYAIVPGGVKNRLLDKETEIIRQMWAVVGSENIIDTSLYRR